MCVKTIPAWKLGVRPNGKALITFNRPSSRRSGVEFIHIPCGQCIDCRLEYSRLWAMRCMHEASLYESNCFITLTFNDEQIDPIASLRKDTFQKFMMRLRKYLSDHRFADNEINCKELGAARQAKRVRYFHAGEYGEEFGRPHHHAILFGYDFPDKVYKRTRDGFTYYNSELLKRLWSDHISKEFAEDLIKSGINRKDKDPSGQYIEWVFEFEGSWYWNYGFSEITDVSFETCAYVARYVCKKITGEKADDHYKVVDEAGNFYDRVPEFCTMSRRPGIGYRWYQKYRDSDAYGRERIHIRGKFESKPPRYYDSKYELDCPGEYAILKEKRLKLSRENPDNSYERQRDKEVVKKAQYAFLKRSLR